MLKPALQSRKVPTTQEGAAIVPRSAVTSSVAALESISLRFVITTMNCDYCDTAHSSLIEHLLFTMHCDEFRIHQSGYPLKKDLVSKQDEDMLVF